MNRNLSCFQYSAITNNATVNNAYAHVILCLWKWIFRVNSWKWDCWVKGKCHVILSVLPDSPPWGPCHLSLLHVSPKPCQQSILSKCFSFCQSYLKWSWASFHVFRVDWKVFKAWTQAIYSTYLLLLTDTLYELVKWINEWTGWTYTRLIIFAVLRNQESPWQVDCYPSVGQCQVPGRGLVKEEMGLPTARTPL